MNDSTLSSLDARKRSLRSEAKRRRAECATAAPAEAVAMLRDRVLAAISVPWGAAVSAYWPMGDEIDPRPLMERLHGRGHPVALPVVVGPGQPLVFRHWHPGDQLLAAGFRTSVPRPEQSEVRPQVLLVPLLAFDRAGYRLGYGGGFYDRTLAALRRRGDVLAVGVAYAGQEIPGVPHDAGDEPLDWVVTEREAIRTERAGGSARAPSGS